MSANGALPAPEDKASYVRAMFGRIARRYDLMNRLMSLGRDGAWRRYTVRQIGRARPRAVLDVATGTGDLALEVLRRHPGARVVGLDFTPQMLVLARAKHAERGRALHLVAGDALRVPAADASFDAVVTGFALRNVTDIPAAFAEMARVTRPGGRLACLEIARPRAPLFRALFRFYFYRVLPLVGGLITGQRAAYTYLPHSLTALPAPDEIAAEMRRVGWADVRYRRLMLGTVAVHTATRPAGS